jgi:uncharacterized delta-60 repeat protein
MPVGSGRSPDDAARVQAVETEGVHVASYLRRLRSPLIFTILAPALLLASASSAWALAKGQPDPTFGSGGFVSAAAGTRLLGTAVQSDGKIVAVGASGFGTPSLHLLVARFTTAGKLDPTFGGGQITGPANVLGQAVAIQPDGKIVVAGTSTDSLGESSQGVVVERLNASGTVDGRFGSGGVVTTLTGASHGQGNAVALAANGEVVVAGDGTIPSGLDQFFPGVALVRLSPSGHLDTSEVVDLGRYSIATGVAIQPDGRIVVGGTQRGDLQTTQTLAARFNANGTRDTSFSGGLFVHQYAGAGGAYSGFNAVALQPDGKVVLAGADLNGATGINALVVRLSAGGAPDGSFGSGGAVNLSASNTSAAAGAQNAPYGALGVVVSAGEIFAAGWYDNFHLKQLALWGVTGRGAPDSSFGTGGTTLISGGGSNSLQANALAVAPDGRLATAGDLTPLLGGGPNGVIGRFGGPAVTPPVLPPVVTSVQASRRVFRVAAKGGSIGNSGMKLSYSMSVAGKTTFTVLQAQAGIISGKRCVKPPRRIRGKVRRCTRIVSFGSFAHNDRKGTNVFHFTGRVGGHKLAPGSYTLQGVPANGRLKGRPFTVSFKIVK